MPIHDWIRVSAGTFHDFHVTWIPLLKHVLNHGVLPKGYYALAEQSSGPIIPDVLTLKEIDEQPPEVEEHGGGTSVAIKPPKATYTATLESTAYLTRTSRIAVRHSSNDRVVAIIEVISPGNKASDREFRKFLEKVVSVLEEGIHFLVIDLHPPTRRDPQGIHSAIWELLGGERPQAHTNKPLTIVSYVADQPIRTYVEPLALGDVLPVVPLFLSPVRYVEVPLEESYLQAVSEIPSRVRAPLEI